MSEIFALLGFGPEGWAAALLLAAGLTLVLSLAGFALGALFGACAAAGRLSPWRLPRLLAQAYGTLFRGIPDLLTIYLLYFGGSVALTGFSHLVGIEGFVGMPTFATGTLAIGIISGAYQCEVLRGAYLAIDKGQFEAARALALPPWITLSRVIAPQLLRVALPGLGNVWQLVLKDSALISVIGLVELMRQAQIAAGATREPFVFYTAAAALYFLIASVSTRVFRHAEEWSSRGMVR
ncbi:ABC transporter permease [Oryzibacter oryziterrae]|uniref:ABC transporter permease n=1 Tax=Oryzibacter oryziterrae TaxID=2766474 RepID=UPI001EEE2405|nr:ABC transporter permease subunit [Oryzibacter oryziterrae]